MRSFIFDVAAVDDVCGVELTEQVLLLAALRDFHVSTSIVGEEEVLVISVRLNPILHLRVVEKLQVSLSLKVLAVVSEENLLEVAIVEDKRIHRPAAFLALVVIACETDSVRAHQGDVLRGI